MIVKLIYLGETVYVYNEPTFSIAKDQIILDKIHIIWTSLC